MMKDRLTISVKGLVTPFLVVNGKEVPIGTVHNAVQTGGAEAIIRALANGSSLSRVYFLYANSSSPTAIGASSGTLTANSFYNAGLASGRGLISCPAVAASLEASESSIDTGVFLSVTDTSEASHLKGIGFTDGRYVYAVGLVLPSQDGDILYAACDITPVAKASNSQVGVRWKTQITVE